MSDTIIRVVNLAKRYRIGQSETYRALRDVLVEGIRTPIRSIANRLRGKTEPTNARRYIWALDDVSFEVKQGEVLGIIGRNGAGKSTLLKILSRITKPTRGYAEIYGRVGSLLEVGTGFHSELTGRENIFLSGAVLGMKRAEIERKFDEIVAFSEIEKFLDTPVKRYSTGMYIRLAFSIAAHLEPEILIVDEVLAVGDLAFQKKCLGKMGEVAQTGRTVLFVSHNMSAVQRLCTRAILLQQGKISLDGEVGEVTETYITRSRELTSARCDLLHAEFPPGQRRTWGSLRFSCCMVKNSSNQPTETFRLGEPITIYLEVHSPKDDNNLDLGFYIDTLNDVRVTTVRAIDQGLACSIRAGIPLRVDITLDNLVLLPGHYTLQIFAHSTGFGSDIVNRAVQFEVIDVPYAGISPLNRVEGVVRTRTTWNFLN